MTSFPHVGSPPVPIPDLPTPVPNPPFSGGDGTLASFDFDVPLVEVPIERPLEPTPVGTFGLELPSNAPSPATRTTPSPEADPVDAPAPRRVVRRRGLPSYAVIAIGGLALACLALVVALVAALGATSEASDTLAAPGPPVPEAIAAAEPEASPAFFPAEPAPIPVDLLTQLEAASDQPLEVELGRLLEAIQEGLGTQSARLEPTLRSYVYRMTARFEWNPHTYRIAVTAPDARLAEARKALLDQLFADAVASGRLRVGTGIGPHALTLVTE